MARRGLHREDRASRVADELLQHALFVILGLVREARERAHADHVAVGPHHGNRLQQVFGLVAVHHHAPFGLELPGPLIDIEDHDVHPEVHGGLLGREPRAEARIEEEHQQRLVAPQPRELEAVALDLLRFGDGLTQVAYVLYAGKFIHNNTVVSICFSVRVSFRSVVVAACSRVRKSDPPPNPRLGGGFRLSPMRVPL